MQSFGRMHLLSLKPDLEVLLPGHDLYLFDKDSWSCMRGLLKLLADNLFANGLADRYLVSNQNEVRFTWTLHLSTPHYSPSDNIVFHWCLVPSGFKQLLESYAACKNLHMGNVCGIPLGMYDKDYQSFADVTKIILVMTLPTDVQLYSSICTTLSSASAECSERVCRLPTSRQGHFLNESESQNLILPCGSQENCQTRAGPFSNTCSQCEEICSLSDVLPTFPLAVADVYKDNFSGVKTEPAADENGEENIGDKFSYHVVQGTESILETTVKKQLLLGNLLHIAKTYAALSLSECSDYAGFHPFPPHKVKRTKIILECPGCNIPSSCTSSSAFVRLLRHVKRRHPMDCDVLLADIVERYAPLIKCMKRKVAKSKVQCLKRTKNEI